MTDNSAITLSKIGNIVCASFRIFPTAEFAKGQVYAILPEGYRPVFSTLSFPMSDGNGGALYAALYGNGECIIWENPVAESLLSACITYFTNSL